jgi:hypothetical protein
MVVAALLAVVVGQALLANGQVRLAALQHQLTLEQSIHRQAELADAKLETPSRIVAYATEQGLVAPGATAATPSLIELPYVSLSVPLPTPKVTPAPAPPPPPTPAVASAGAPTGSGTTSATSAASTTTSAASTPTSAASTTATTTTPTSTP